MMLQRYGRSIALIGVLACEIAFELSPVAPAGSAQPVETAAFEHLLRELWPSAQNAGVSRTVFDAAFAGTSPDPTLAAKMAAQPEFNKPIQSYINAAVSPERIQRGITAARKWQRELQVIERRFGVPSEIVLAVLGMESDFSPPKGDRYVVRSLATLAALSRSVNNFSQELVAALTMLQSGVAKTELQGSWAGAMGYPQFLPSAYNQYAVRFDESAAKPDIWTSVPDSLASIANFLKLSGWRSGRRWGCEVIVPRNFDYRSLHSAFADFAKLGFRAANGRALPQSGNATLYFPAGAAGPAVLLSDNYWTIKQYNNSDAYALSVATLADRIAGRPALHAAWPNGARSLDRNERERLQEQLTHLGYYTGVVDGKFGPTTRDAVHAFQLGAGVMPADGFPSEALLSRVDKAANGQ